MGGRAFTAHKGWKQWLLLLLLLVALYVLLPQVGTFRHSFTVLRGAVWHYVLLAVGFAALSYLAAAGTYCLLAFRQLSYARTVLVQIGSTFANRLLPAGVGGIGVYYDYLRQARHTGSQAASVVAVNNLLGFVGHMLLLACLLGIGHDHLPPLHLRRVGHIGLWLGVGLLAMSVVILVLGGRWQHILTRNVRKFLAQIVSYRKRLPRLSAALVCSMGLTLCNVLSLWSCALALHTGLSFVTILVVFTFSVVLGTATPTPGGLGGVEAGLVAGMIAYHVDGAAALAVALVYRLINYWLALAAGAIAFSICQRRGYL